MGKKQSPFIGRRVQLVEDGQPILYTRYTAVEQILVDGDGSSKKRPAEAAPAAAEQQPAMNGGGSGEAAAKKRKQEQPAAAQPQQHARPGAGSNGHANGTCDTDDDDEAHAPEPEQQQLSKKELKKLKKQQRRQQPQQQPADDAAATEAEQQQQQQQQAGADADAAAPPASKGNAEEAARIRQVLGFSSGPPAAAAAPAAPAAAGGGSGGGSGFSFNFNDLPDKSDEAAVAAATDAKLAAIAAVTAADKDGFVPRRVFVGGMPYSYSREQVAEYWGWCGEVESLDLMTFPDSGRFRGIAFITFKTQEGYEAALACDGEAVDGQTLKVERCKAAAVAKTIKAAASTHQRPGQHQHQQQHQQHQQHAAAEPPATPASGGGDGPAKTPGYNVAYVGNIAFEARTEDISALFSACGVTKVRLHTDKDSRKSKGYAHVHFGDAAGLDAALGMSGTEFMGRSIKVSYAQPKKN